MAHLVVLVVDAMLGSMVMPDMPAFDPGTTKEVARSVIGCAIWIPYTYLSRRVKNTFIN